MSTQSEQAMELKLVKQLEDTGFKFAALSSQKDLVANLKTQLETLNQKELNQTALTDTEFAKVLNHLNNGDSFERSRILRDKMQLRRDDDTDVWLTFLNQSQWCRNHFQVARQINQSGPQRFRYDVTLLINGLPLVQIELKKTGLQLKDAFHQINKYKRRAYATHTGLFLYVQIFVISNGVNTKYYAHNQDVDFKQTFFWTHKDGTRISRLEDFARHFLQPCHISKMICKYMVLQQANKKKLMVLRPYQYHAVEALAERVKLSDKNGYIWHATGSGKTLTSFKACKVLMDMPEVDRVVFVVDRTDLDTQTLKEFNQFRPGSVDGGKKTRDLVNQFADDKKLIVTTIQKLNIAIQNPHHLNRMKKHSAEQVVFVFDECHRSQFGETHRRIKAFFKKARMFGFTGTPIFAENAVRNALGKRTTKELFDDCLHKYLITDAVRDENVLKFVVEYHGKFHEKNNPDNTVDVMVEDIDRKEVMESEERLQKIVDFIIRDHHRKTHNRQFTAMFCLNSIEALITCYKLFKKRQTEGAHNLKVAAIFSLNANEEEYERYNDYHKGGSIIQQKKTTTDADYDATPQELLLAANTAPPYHNTTADTLQPGPEDDEIFEEIQEEIIADRRDQLQAFIDDYNKMYGENCSCADQFSYYKYHDNIANRTKNGAVDLLMVVDIFLTGFDAKVVNTLYVDKNLKHHGLIQAFSRTNRTNGTKKSHGNIVCFRPLKEATDKALTLFANKNANETIFMPPYDECKKTFNEKVAELLIITPTADDADHLYSEDDKHSFVKAFRHIIRLHNQLICYTDFNWNDLDMNENLFDEFKSKYLDIYDSTRNYNGEKESILEDVDFQLELIQRDEINVSYILNLLARLKNCPKNEQKTLTEQILKDISGERRLRSKKKLIEQFILEQLPLINYNDDIPNLFSAFWNSQRQITFNQICQEENLNDKEFKNILNDYLYTQRPPIHDDILKTLNGPAPSILSRKKTAQHLSKRLLDFVETFYEGMDV